MIATLFVTFYSQNYTYRCKMLLCMPFFALGLFCASAVAASEVCLPCHGPQGVTDKAGVPNIAGLNVGYLTSTLNNYLAGTRATAVTEHAQGIKPEEVDTLAALYSKLPWEYAKGNAIDPVKVIAGDKPSTRCRLCHAEDGRSQEDDMPRMAGQKLDYLLARMHAIKQETKSIMPNKMMAMYKELTDADMEAISHFFAAQK